MHSRPRLLNLGEGGLVVEFSDGVEEPANLAVQVLDAFLKARLGQAPGGPAGRGTGVRLVPTYRSLLVLFDPLRLKREVLLKTVEEGLERIAAGGAECGADGGRAPSAPPGQPRLVEIPVCYAERWALDLAEVAQETGLSPSRVVELHSSHEYRVYMLGFQIGYPYMASLPPELRVPRLARPRLKTPRGAVAIAGELTGVYSLEAPGGWRVIGNTPLPMWHLDWDPPVLLRPGDRIRFYPVSEERYAEIANTGWLPGGVVSPAAGGAEDAAGGGEAVGPAPFAEVLSPGPLATVQDLGRPGYERYGLGPGGAMDRFAIRVGNRLLGNPEGAAAVEITAGGAEFILLDTVPFVWAGGHGNLTLDGRQIPPWTVILGRPGQRLLAGYFQEGFRAYLCPRGGIAVPRVAGSRSTNLSAGFGGLEGRPLRAGDVVQVFGRASSSARGATPEGKTADRDALQAIYGALQESEPRLRVVPGPQDTAFTADGLRTFFGSAYRIAAESNRMGYRLSGPQVKTHSGSDIVSDGAVAGAVQVPGNGQPVLLMADHQTTGGYTKLGAVAAADLAVAAQLAPGRDVRFVATTAAEAEKARLEAEHLVAGCAGELVRFRMRIAGRMLDVAVDEAKGEQG